MIFRGMTVNLMERFANRPIFKFHIDGVPRLDDYRFKKNGSMYYAEKDGAVRFFSYSKPGDGFGGDHFRLTMEDGSKEVLIGPWSSRAFVAMVAGAPPCIEVAVNGYAQALTLAWVRSQGIRIAEMKSHGDETYYEILTPTGELWKPLFKNDYLRVIGEVP